MRIQAQTGSSIQNSFEVEITSAKKKINDIDCDFLGVAKMWDKYGESSENRTH